MRGVAGRRQSRFADRLANRVKGEAIVTYGCSEEMVREEWRDVEAVENEVRRYDASILV